MSTRTSKPCECITDCYECGHYCACDDATRAEARIKELEAVKEAALNLTALHEYTMNPESATIPIEKWDALAAALAALHPKED